MIPQKAVGYAVREARKHPGSRQGRPPWEVEWEPTDDSYTLFHYRTALLTVVKSGERAGVIPQREDLSVSDRSGMAALLYALAVPAKITYRQRRLQFHGKVSDIRLFAAMGR